MLKKHTVVGEDRSSTSSLVKRIFSSSPRASPAHPEHTSTSKRGTLSVPTTSKSTESVAATEDIHRLHSISSPPIVLTGTPSEGFSGGSDCVVGNATVISSLDEFVETKSALMRMDSEGGKLMGKPFLQGGRSRTSSGKDDDNGNARMVEEFDQENDEERSDVAGSIGSETSAGSGLSLPKKRNEYMFDDSDTEGNISPINGGAAVSPSDESCASSKKGDGDMWEEEEESENDEEERAEVNAVTSIPNLLAATDPGAQAPTCLSSRLAPRASATGKFLSPSLHSASALPVPLLSLAQGICAASHELDSCFLHTLAEPKSLMDGSTAAVLIVTKSYIALANTGDSRGVLYRTPRTTPAENKKESLKRSASCSAASEKLLQQRRVGPSSLPLNIANTSGELTPLEKKQLQLIRSLRKYNIEAVALSTDHTLTQRRERARVESKGASTMNNRVDDKLSMTRAFGNLHLKDLNNPEKSIIVCDPDVRFAELSFGDSAAGEGSWGTGASYIVLACDGLWDVMKNEEVGIFVAKRLEKAAEEKGCPPVGEIVKVPILFPSINI